MKKCSILLMSLLLCFAMATPTMAATTVNVYVNGSSLETSDQPAVIMGGRTMVPMRAIFEELGCTVKWDGANRSVTAFDKSTMLTLVINDPWIFVCPLKEFTDHLVINGGTPSTSFINSHSIKTDVPATILNSRTMVPLRVVSESLGCKVDWNANTRTVYIIG